jgi:hypothetical protein
MENKELKVENLMTSANECIIHPDSQPFILICNHS